MMAWLVFHANAFYHFVNIITALKVPEHKTCGYKQTIHLKCWFFLLSFHRMCSAINSITLNTTLKLHLCVHTEHIIIYGACMDTSVFTQSIQQYMSQASIYLCSYRAYNGIWSMHGYTSVFIQSIQWYMVHAWIYLCVHTEHTMVYAQRYISIELLWLHITYVMGNK